ncbi:DUF1289 domain-containing protein [Vibrio palustris]|uniref:DUF1289 domain-containing protein n=1 Tax=Vibrio palustris TaxID=1918946 RepID=UPI00098525DD|nr:DUF1289 domain-containing protein [Vibrio palustris]
MNKLKKIASPCIRHCCLNEDDICIGCWRSLSEILVWQQADDQHRACILERCQQRSQQTNQKDDFL